MSFFLADVVGDGTDNAPFRAAGTEDFADFRSIDLRPDSTVRDGKMLVWTSDLPKKKASIVVLGDDPDEASTACQKVLSNRLGVNLEAKKFGRMAAELLIDYGDDSNQRRWNQLRPNHRGEWEILLGERIFFQPPVRGGATQFVVETFTVANGATVTGDNAWTETLQGSIWSIVSNKAHLTGNLSLFGLCRCDADLVTNNHHVICAVTWQANTGRIGPTVRGNGSNSDCYLCAGTATGDLDELSKVVSTTRTTIGSQAHSINAGASAVTGGANGSSISVLIGAGSVLSVTDTAITVGTRFGIGASSAGATSSDGDVDTMTANDFTAPVTTSDTLTTSDAATRAAALGRTTSDTLTTADAAARQVIHVRTAADTDSFADTAARGSTQTRAAADTKTLTDAAARGAGEVRAAADTVTTADTATRRSGSARTASDQAYGGPTVYDSFNRADSGSSLGTADSGHLWTAEQGSIGIESGRAYAPLVNFGTVMTVSAGLLHSTQSIVVASNTGVGFLTAGLVARFVDNDNFYFALVTNNSRSIYKFVGGVMTQLAGTATGFGEGDVLGFIVTGSYLSLLRNGTVVESAVDTSLTTGTKSGFYIGHVAARVDSYLGAPVGDVATRTTSRMPSASETTVWADSAARTTAEARTAADTRSQVDTAARATTAARTAADAVGTADAATRASVRTPAAADTTATADAVARTSGAARSGSETETTADAATAGTSGGRQASDALVTADAASRAVAAVRAASDVADFDDTLTSPQNPVRTAADTVATSDTAVRAVGAVRDGADSVDTDDQASATAGGPTTLNDSVTTADSGTRSVGAHRTASDAATTADSLAVTVAAHRTATDTAVRADSAARTTTAARTAADSVFVADVATARRGSFRFTADFVATVEVATVTTARTVTAADSVTYGDSATRTTAAWRTTADSLATVDVATVVAPLTPTYIIGPPEAGWIVGNGAVNWLTGAVETGWRVSQPS